MLERGCLLFSHPLTESEQHIINTAMNDFSEPIILLGRKIFVMEIRENGYSFSKRVTELIYDIAR